MNRSEAEELVSVLKTVSGICEDLNQKFVALENILSHADRQRYDKELKRLREHGNLTNAALAVATLEEKILPPDQS
jgi:hypothetical protein